jgi:pimeloyl-ACP methyl ester carboxylesterase
MRLRRFLAAVQFLLVGRTLSMRVRDYESEPVVDKSSVFEVLSRTLNLDPEAYLRVPDIIEREGYPAEVHRVHTDDGYILEMQRIPYSPSNVNDKRDRPPILMLHAYTFSGSVFVTNTKEQSPGFIFADAGYDVWIAEYRGTIYSLRHDVYNHQQKEFWNFTYEELGMYDTPAMIDYVINETGHSQIYLLLQHSAAVPAMIALSKRPEYNSKIKLIVGLSPIISLKYGNSLSNVAYRFPKLAEITYTLHDLLGGEIPCRAPVTRFFSRFGPSLYPVDLMRKGTYLAFAKYDGRTTNFTRYPVFMSHFPDGMSVRASAHLVQMVARSAFAPYDYGHERNMDVYGKTSPDEYPLHLVTAPMLATWTYNEILVCREDVEHLVNRLPDATMFRVPNPGFVHLDYVYAHETRESCYLPIIARMKSFEHQRIGKTFLRGL